MRSVASETDSHPFSTKAERWAANHLTQEEAGTDAIDLALGVLSLSSVSPEVARTRVELVQAFFTFITRLRAAKGLRSDDNEDIVKLLGRLGTASMELAHCTDINAVLQHARVTLEMPGGKAQLAKWHRLGHLQSVAGSFAEVMAKPSTITTVKDHAKELLLEAKREAEEKAEKDKREAEEQAAKEKREAEEQEALRSQMLKTLSSLDSSISAIPSEALAKAGAMMQEYIPDEDAELVAKAGQTALAMSKASNAFAERIYDTMRSEHGVGPALEAAGLDPEMMALTAQAVKEPRWLLWEGPSNRENLARRVLKDQVASSRRPASGPGEVCEFLEANKLNMLVVMDEADEPYKECGNIIARELDLLRGDSPQMIYYVSGSAAAMRDILFEPTRVDTGVYDVKKFRYKKSHSDKQIPLPPLEPLSSLEDHAKAIVAAGSAFSNFHSDATRFLANSRCPDERALFGKTVLRVGGVLRALLSKPTNVPETPPLGLDKMQLDIIATGHGRQLASVFAAHFKFVIKGLCPETVLDQLVSPSVGFPALGLDIGKLSARVSEKSGESVAAEALMSSLSTLSDCGVLTLAEAKWRPVSWTAVLSIMLVDEGDCSLPFEARDDLSHATVGAKTTEPVLAQAFCKSAAKSAHFVGTASEGQRESLLRSLERLSLVDDAAVAKVVNLKWDDVREDASVLREGMLYKPSPDKGVDIVLLVRDPESQLVHLLLLQAKATSSGAADAGKSTDSSLTGWNKIVPRFTAQVDSWRDFHPVSLSLLRDGESLVVWNVVVTNKDVNENALHGRVPAEIGIHEGALRMAMFGGVDGAATSSCGRIHGPHWVVAFGDHLLSGLPPAVLDWARNVKRQAWGGHTAAEAAGAADQAEA
ncbi:hypothetical protein FNF29_02328 [Cafeteria roenbergensis]|uniref:Uncharacterized protein n=1 Tax=Cafeteria roenbergensis TaxID=33653 RepID=A0A5A8CQH3_CAFRO|nr:hypothetical protein FNF29_02328 [Cafeteria roenbergensis]|eukprot:KAA0154450.1 hypothetical protein FNF29_02328 [Cafeteria roenbergensis]